MEFELTFLAREMPPEIKGNSGELLTDTYFPETGVRHPSLRIRQRGDVRELTKKIQLADGDASAHRELTVPLTREEYSGLAGDNKRTVSKVRYAVSIGGYEAEVDVFQGALAGLVLIDFEFPNEDEMRAFVPPAVCLADVTQEEFIAGGVLAGKCYDDLKEQLGAFNYQPIQV